jgi:predicted RND superfamily exporter protein
VLVAFIPTIEIDTDPENMLPASHPDRVFHNQIKKEFAIHDAIVVGAVNRHDDQGVFNPRSLAALHALTTSILAMDGVIEADVMALSTSDNIEQAGPATVRFEWLMKEAPQSQDEASALQAKVQRLPLMVDTLVSSDHKAAAIYVPIESKDQSYRISQEIQAVIAGGGRHLRF